MNSFSIILPVRNGGEYLKQCVNSILRQRFSEFQLHILDNCSTDGSSEWIRSVKDDRISIHPADKPLSIEENWARITTIQKNEFITLIGHDDILYPNYLEVMDALIRKHPKATLYQTHFSYIDSEGALIRKCKPMDEIQYASEFLAFFLSSHIDTMGTGFMMRAKDYDACGGIPPRYPNLLFADFELFINLSRQGYKATAFDHTFSFRLHQSMTTTSSDIKFNEAFGIFIDYLQSLKQVPEFDPVIQRYAVDYIMLFSKGLSHRLLRTPISKRNGKKVGEVIALTKEYANRLVPGNDFDPEEQFSVRLARQIDSNPLTRSLFLFLKKYRNKPILK